MTNFDTFVLTVLSAAGFSTVVALVVVWLARNWIGERLRQSIKHEYDQKLVALNAELKARTDTKMALLDASIEREAGRHQSHLGKPERFRGTAHRSQVAGCARSHEDEHDR